MSRGGVIAVLVLLGASLASACGGGGTKTVTVSSGGAASSTSAPKTTTGGPATTPTGPAPTGASAPALASRDGMLGDHPIKLEIAELKRSGFTTTLMLRLTNPTDNGAQVADNFDDGIFQKIRTPGASSIDGGDSLDGIYLIDTVNRKKYLVGRDSDNACTCDSDLGNAFVYNEGPLLLSAIYGAPPPAVKSVDVFVPKFGTFKDVPLG